MYTKQVKLLVFVGAVGLVVAMSAYALALNVENKSVRSQVKVHATNLSARLEVALDRKFEVLYGLQALFNASVHVDADEFSLAAQSFLARDRTLEALEWVPKVRHSDVDKYVSEAQERIPGFSIKDSQAGGDFVEAAPAESYYPIYYLEPSTVYRSARGLNLASYGPSWKALQAARDSGKLTVSDVLSEVSGAKPFSLIFAVLPVYKSSPLTYAERQESLEGFVVGLFQSEQVLHGVIDEYAALEMDVSVETLSVNGARDLVFSSHSGGVKPKDSDFSQSVIIPLKNERWILTVTPTLEGQYILRSATPVWVFALVLLFTTIGSITIAVLIRQRELVSDAVVERTAQLNDANQRLENLSNTDFLTGLANRRRFEQLAEKAWQRAATSGEKLGVIMIDVDQFKLYNDHFGHLSGDLCLKRVASVLSSELGRRTELVARYGGEEFIALLEGNHANVNNVARLLLAMREQAIPHAPTAGREAVTFSIGVAWTIGAVGKTLDHFIAAADDALYQAKEQGRDRMIEVEFREQRADSVTANS